MKPHKQIVRGAFIGPGTAVVLVWPCITLCQIVPGSSTAQPPVSPTQAPANPPAVQPTQAPVSQNTSLASSPFYVGEKLHLFDVVTNYGSYVTGEVDHICSLPGAEVRVMKIEPPDASSAQYGQLVDVVPIKKGALPKGMAGIPGCDSAKYLGPGGGEYDVYPYNLEQSRYNAQTVVTGILAIPYKFHFSDRSATVGTTIGGYVGYQTSFQNLFTVTPIVSVGLALVSSSPAQVASGSSGGSPASSPGKTGSTGTTAGVTVAIGLIGNVSNQGKAGVQYGVVTGIDWVGRSANYIYEGKPWLAVEVGYNFSASTSADSSGGAK